MCEVSGPFQVYASDPSKTLALRTSLGSFPHHVHLTKPTLLCRTFFASAIAGHQGISRWSRKNRPVGPPSGSEASQAGVSDPLSGERGALGPPIDVRTHPGHTAFTKIPRGSRLSSRAKMRVRALSPTFDTR